MLMAIMKKLAKSMARVCVVAVLLLMMVLLVCSGCIDSLMFHPEFAKGGYDATAPGYVDIGTNGVRIAAVVLGPERGRKAILRCPGNAEDMMGTLWALGGLAGQGFTVASVDYPGYGLSDGSPDEKGCYRNVHRLYDWLVETRGFRPEDIIVDGFSIGTGPATELAASKPVGGLVLEAPFLSAPRAVTRVRILPVDPFPNLKRIGDVKCPVLIIHGTKDNVIPFSQGKALFELANEPKRFVEVEGADHNHLPGHLGERRYQKLIGDFIEQCIKGERK